MAIPTFDPMLATNNGPPPKNPVIEPKWDGVHSIVTLRADGTASIRFRNGKDVSAAYPELHVRPPSMVGREGVFDGEIIAVDDAGKCSFQRLQRRMNVLNPSRQTIAVTPVFFVVFDVLWLDGDLMTSTLLSTRRATLEALMAPGSAWQLTNRFDGPVTEELLAMARDVGLEGLILKGEGPYTPGVRTKNWAKVKFRRTMLAVIGGGATDSSSLAAGVFMNGELRYVGQVGMAMRATAETLDAFLAKIRQDGSPFVDLAKGAPVKFVTPHVVVEVSYTEVTAAGTLRQPIFVAVRPDILADTVIAEGETSTILARRTGPVKMRANQRL